MKPETKLMSAIFGVWYRDEDLCESRDGVTLRDTNFYLLEEISEQHRRHSPAFSKRVTRVIALRFGFEDGQSKTLEQVGKEFGVTRETIRRHEAKVLRFLRHPMRARVLKPLIRGELDASS